MKMKAKVAIGEDMENSKNKFNTNNSSRKVKTNNTPRQEDKINELEEKYSVLENRFNDLESHYKARLKDERSLILELAKRMKPEHIADKVNQPLNYVQLIILQENERLRDAMRY
jgi:hypothetical protein